MGNSIKELKRKRGRPKQKSRMSYQYNVRLNEESRDKLEEISFEYDKTKSDLIREAIDILYKKYKF